MKKAWAAGVLVLAGCAEAPTPYIPPKTPCEAASRILSSPYATPGQTMAALEAAKNHGCLGPVREQQIRIIR